MTVLEKTITDFAIINRIRVSQIIALMLLMIVLFSDNSWPENTMSDFILEFTGFILIGICTFGRLWASMYIAGYKDDSLITVGPYSIVRHPLYLFSFIGATGLGLASENIIVIIMLPVLFLLYYRPVMLSEEDKLKKIYGQEYLDYMEKRSRLIPKFSLFFEPETYVIKSKKFRKSILDVMWFFIFFMILQFIEKAHHIEIIPVLFKLP